MKEVAIIVCNNGLGHIKRVLWILKYLYENLNNEIRANVFVNTNNLQYFTSMINCFKQNKWKILFLDIESDIYDFELEFVIRYKEYLKKSDYIWSDNLIFPLKYRKDVLFTGSFLWIDVNNVNKFIEKERNILISNRPIMIGNKYFATPNVRELTEFCGVGIYKYFNIIQKVKNSKSLLISCGKSQAGVNYFKENFNSIEKKIKNIPKDIIIYIEPDYYNFFNSHENVIKATFTEEMYAQVTAASIRPGFGTISDILLKGGRIFTFYEDNNYELEHNSNVIKELNIGENHKEIIESFDSALAYFSDEKQQLSHLNSVKQLDFNGLDETFKIIKNLIE